MSSRLQEQERKFIIIQFPCQYTAANYLFDHVINTICMVHTSVLNIIHCLLVANCLSENLFSQ